MGADSHSQREDCDGRKNRRLTQHAKGVAELVPEGTHMVSIRLRAVDPVRSPKSHRDRRRRRGSSQLRLIKEYSLAANWLPIQESHFEQSLRQPIKMIGT